MNLFDIVDSLKFTESFDDFGMIDSLMQIDLNKKGQILVVNGQFLLFIYGRYPEIILLNIVI